MSGVADVYALAAGRLATVVGPLAGWSVWPAPPDATGLPAVWLELSAGGGADYDNPTLAPLVLRIVAVPLPQAQPQMHAVMADLIDTLDAGYRPPLASTVVTGPRTWTIDTAEVGGTDYDALLYDLALAVATC